MDWLFNHSGILKKDISPEEERQLLDLPSGSDYDYLSGFSCSDDDPSVNPNQLFGYDSFDSDSSAEDMSEAIELSHLFPITSQRVDNEHVSGPKSGRPSNEIQNQLEKEEVFHGYCPTVRCPKWLHWSLAYVECKKKSMQISSMHRVYIHYLQ